MYLFDTSFQTLSYNQHLLHALCCEFITIEKMGAFGSKTQNAHWTQVTCSTIEVVSVCHINLMHLSKL